MEWHDHTVEPRMEFKALEPSGVSNQIKLPQLSMTVIQKVN